MKALHETTESVLARSELQRQALRNAIAWRRLERMREEKDLHWFVTDVWDEPENTASRGS